MAHDETDRSDRRSFLQAGALATASAMTLAPAAAAAQDAAAKAYIQQAAGTSGSTADEIQRLADLKAQGVISDAEFEAGKAKALSS